MDSLLGVLLVGLMLYAIIIHGEVRDLRKRNRVLVDGIKSIRLGAAQDLERPAFDDAFVRRHLHSVIEASNRLIEYSARPHV